MATNAQGYLPADIVLKAQDADKLDGLDSSASPGQLALRSALGAVNEADNPVHWNQLKGVPSAFADGTDAGITTIAVQYIEGEVVTAHAGVWTYADAACPTGSVVIGGGAVGTSRKLHLTDLFAAGMQWVVWMDNTDTTSRAFQAVATCLAITPASSLSSAAKGVRVLAKDR